MKHDIHFIKANMPFMMEHYGVNMWCARKGIDGNTSKKQKPGSTFDAIQLVTILGEEDNTPEGRRAWANPIITLLNRNDISDNYTYPRKVKFGEDHTMENMRPNDALLLDKDVITLMLAAYEGTSLVELSEFDQVVGSFFADIVCGKAVMLANAGGDSDNEDATTVPAVGSAASAIS